VSDQAAAQKAVRFADDTTQEGFTQIPNAILRDASISAGARLTYGLLSSFAWQADECFVGQKRLGELAGVGDRQIRKYLTELEGAGLLEVTQQGLHKPNIYTLFGAGPDRNCRPGQDRNCGSDEEDAEEEDSENPCSPQPPVVKSEQARRIDTAWGTYVVEIKPRGRGRELQPDDRKILRDVLKVADVEEVETAIRECAASDFHMKRGKHKNRQGGPYKSLGKIFKPRPTKGETWRSRIEWWLDRAEEREGSGEVTFDVNAEAKRIREEQERD
jgi:hypothetical protein